MYILPARSLLFGLLAFLLAVHGWAMVSAGYFYVWWLDIALHLGGGFWLGLVVIRSFYGRLFPIAPPPPWVAFCVLVAFVSLGGVAWEFFEFGYDWFFARRNLGPAAQLGIGDTMADLFFDLLGGAIAHGIFIKNNRKNG